MSAIATVPFHNQNLLLIEHKGEPFTFLKPIVEGMGLDWGYQRRKIQDNSNRWGSAVIASPSKSGEQSMVCLPLRKLFGWLMSIHPSRVKKELRETIEMYQDECDNALWSYWSEGQAVNPRSTITPAQQRAIQELVAKLAIKNNAYAKYYGALKTTFKIAKYDQLLASQFDEALEVIKGVVVELSAPKESDTMKKSNHPEQGREIMANRRFLLSYDQDGKEHMLPIPSDAVVMTMQKLLKAINEPNGIQVSTKDLADFASASLYTLQRRSDFYQHKALNHAAT